jgi:hypothetical protein
MRDRDPSLGALQTCSDDAFVHDVNADHLAIGGRVQKIRVGVQAAERHRAEAARSPETEHEQVESDQDRSTVEGEARMPRPRGDLFAPLAPQEVEECPRRQP